MREQTIHNLQCTLCLHATFARVFKALNNIESESALYRITNLLEFINFNDLAIANYLREAYISFALLLPHVRSRPLIDESENFQEEYTQVVRLDCRATMDAWND